MEDQTNEVATSIRNKIESLPATYHITHHCIYKVPEHIRNAKEQYYRPSIVSIGPIYYRDPSLQTIQDLKLMHLQCFLQANNSYTIENYINLIREWEQEARNYYSDNITLSSNEFIEMLLVDAAFIICLIKCSTSVYFLKKHPVHNKVQLLLYLEKDLCLEENQLPFFILQGLYDIAFGTTYPSMPFSDEYGSKTHLDPTQIQPMSDPKLSFLDITSVFISNGLFRGRELGNRTIRENIFRASKINHIVDLLRIAGLPSILRVQVNNINNNQDYNYNPEFPLSATELNSVGVKFMASEGKLLDIRFINGVLQIPNFTLRETVEAVYRSILFYEQCHYFNDSYFVDFVCFLDKLIKTPADVQILVKNGIINNWLGSDEEVVNLFQGVSKQVILNLPNFYYSGVSRELNAYANSSWNRWKTILRRDYFNHPWACISVIYALVLLVLTLLQTISSNFTCQCMTQVKN